MEDENTNNTREKDSPQAVSENPDQHLKAPLTPFRRNRSRVLFASSTSPSSLDDNIATPEHNSSTNTLKIKVLGPTKSLIRKNKNNKVSTLPSIASESGEEVLTSSDEATGHFCSDELSPISSLTGSWRGSDRSSSNGSLRGSPSQRSQDSGYSDSGESNVGCHNDADHKINLHQPQVRHITRVYFGDYSRTPSTCDRSNNTDEAEFLPSNEPKNIFSVSTPRLVKIGKRKSNCTYNNNSHNNIVNNHTVPNSLEKSYTNNSLKSLSPTNDSDDIETELEHKSIRDVTISTPQNKYSNKKLSKTILKALFNDQRICQDYNKKNASFEAEKTTSRNYRKGLQYRRDPNRSRNNEKLLEDKSSSNLRRQEPLKARRRWSSSDMDHCQNSILSTGEANALQNYSNRKNYKSTSHLNGILPHNQLSSPTQDIRNDCVDQWLRELRGLCESECMNTLQSKSLYSDSSVPPSVSTPQTTLAGIQRRAHTVSAEFALLCQRLEQLQLEQVPVLVRSLVSHIQTFIQTHSSDHSSQDSKLAKSKSSVKQQIKVVDQICNRLIEICSETIILSNKHESTNGEVEDEVEISKSPSKFERQIVINGEINREMIREFIQIVTALGHAFTKLVDLLLVQGLTSLVAVLEEETSVRCVERAVTEITGLGLNGGHVCRLVGRVGGIRALLGVCIESRFQIIRPLALRALATVCCVAEGISCFEKEGGVDVIADILCDESFPEEERSEAAGVLAQITSPWVEDNHSLSCLRSRLNGLIKALTDLAESTTSAEVFLLTSAALANLTFLDVSIIDALLTSSTHKVLLTAATVEDNLSVFTKDQIATILANMSSASVAAKEIVAAGGIDVLLSLLRTGPADSLRIAEISATERVQQKSAIALSRICTDPVAANSVLSSGGAARLVELCKNETERNQSDAVLVACLAALRKIASSCGNEELRLVDASELVEPRLLDSFLIYSSQQESYV